MLPAALLLPLAPLLALFPSTPSMSTTHAAQAPAPSYAFDPPADGKFPVPRPSLSYWLQGVRADPLLDYRSEGGLPDQADVVIIGSGVRSAGSLSALPCWRGTSARRAGDLELTDGLPQPVCPPCDCPLTPRQMSGSLVAYELLHSADPPKSVVILEARETCSGATGRCVACLLSLLCLAASFAQPADRPPASSSNAGHCKPDTYKGFTKYARLFGEDMALAILRNEGETFRALVAFVEAHDVDCDLWQGDTLDVAMSKGASLSCEVLTDLNGTLTAPSPLHRRGQEGPARDVRGLQGGRRRDGPHQGHHRRCRGRPRASCDLSSLPRHVDLAC